MMITAGESPWQNKLCKRNDPVHVSFNKHNAYKHIQPGINEKNEHMLSILSSLEDRCSLLFSCLKSHSEAYSETCQTSR